MTEKMPPPEPAGPSKEMLKAAKLAADYDAARRKAFEEHKERQRKRHPATIEVPKTDTLA